ncbi:hypothetical protein N657DRAFT_640716 [Parathielavia appendiculata]|uniref:Uncharacterized protein n=1 Tax=Parathielavia appendiculata TaxID=2587402 RepID=A0AAN6U5K7_9PEZI|nr:hypothetical protein N657DRAFT_640716 [Parathielavia appendiculata]
MPGRKRKSAPAAPEAPPSRRRSRRISESGEKSSYFKADSPSETDGNVTAPRKASGRGRPSKKSKAETESDANEGDYNDENEAVEKPNQGSDDEFDEDAPPKVTVIPLPKLRDTGGIEYADDRLHPNTLAFLKDLKANNKRTWLKSHDAEYRRALKDWESYVTTLTDKIIAADPTIPELPFKDVNFRIYRDIRFSNDPTPYKPHFSVAFSRTGRKGPYACYYVHVEPGACFIGGGLWHPDGAALAKLRASIDERPARWRRVLNEPRFKETFLGISPATSSSSIKQTKGGRGKRGNVEAGKDGEDDEEAALRAFADGNKEGALKTRPKGFIPEHRNMQLLKLRNFTVGRKVADALFTGQRGQEEVASVIGDMVGFITHLNRIVMPDPGDDESGEDEE